MFLTLQPVNCRVTEDPRCDNVLPDQGTLQCAMIDEYGAMVEQRLSRISYDLTWDWTIVSAVRNRSLSYVMVTGWSGKLLLVLPNTCIVCSGSHETHVHIFVCLCRSRRWPCRDRVLGCESNSHSQCLWNVISQFECYWIFTVMSWLLPRTGTALRGEGGDGYFIWVRNILIFGKYVPTVD
jgi:hypothetical protein